MSRLVLVDKGALQMIFNAMERKAVEEGRPILQEMVDEVKKSCINVTEFKLVDGPITKRGWAEDKVYEKASDLDTRQCSRFPENICKKT